MVGTCDVDSPFQNQERLKKKKKASFDLLWKKM